MQYPLLKIIETYSLRFKYINNKYDVYNRIVYFFIWRERRQKEKRHKREKKIGKIVRKSEGTIPHIHNFPFKWAKKRFQT